MSELLLDTNILIFYGRNNSVAAQIENDHNLQGSQFRPVITTITVGEALAFALIRNWGDTRREKWATLIQSFPSIGIDDPTIVDCYAKLRHLSESNGLGIGKNDLWIAAAAKVSGLTLITADKDFFRLPPGTISLIKIDEATGKTI